MQHREEPHRGGVPVAEQPPCELDVAGDHEQQVVGVVHDAAGEAAEREQPLLALVHPLGPPHAQERPSDAEERGGGAVSGKAHLRSAGAADRAVRHEVQHRNRGGSRVPLELADHLQRDAGGRSGAHHDHVDRAASGVRHDSPQPRPVDLRQLLQPVDRMDDAREQDRARTRARLVHGNGAASRCLGTPRRQ